jgi:cell division protein FtsI/penicillin-binding protein 2
MIIAHPLKLLVVGGLMLCVGAVAADRVFSSPAQNSAQQTPLPAELAQLSYDALEDHAGVVIVVDPQYGNVLKRVSRGMDVRFASSPFETARVVTAYAALDAGIIREQTQFACDDGGEQVNVVEALSRPCPAFFAELSKRIKPAAYKRAAEMLGFSYYGSEERPAALRMKPVPAKIPVNVSGDEFTALAVRGAGLEAEDLHFAQFASSLASGVTAAERLAHYLLTTSRGIVPPTVPLNRRALDAVQRGLVRAVDDGAAKAAANIDCKVAGAMGGDGKAAIFVSYAPADAPKVALVVYVKEAAPRDAAEVAGRFYRAYFKSM